MPPTNSPESAREPATHFGMRLDQLSDEILHGIVAIYYEVAKDETITERTLRHQFRAETVMDPGRAEYRLGSMLNDHSKLFVRHRAGGLISFGFYANHQTQADEDPSSPRWHVAKEIDDTFRRRVDEFLISLGIAEPLTPS